VQKIGRMATDEKLIIIIIIIIIIITIIIIIITIIIIIRNGEKTISRDIKFDIVIGHH
jgi:heme/copper-type cytochrome/quinol oxidase subunit 2